MLVTMVEHCIGNMPMEILNLEERRYVESVIKNGKTHLLRNVIGQII